MGGERPNHEFLLSAKPSSTPKMGANKRVSPSRFFISSGIEVPGRTLWPVLALVTLRSSDENDKWIC